MRTTVELVEVLRRLADYIEECPDSEIALILTRRKDSGPAKGRDTETVSKDWLSTIASRLRAELSRDTGYSLLSAEVRNRKTLEALARFLQLPVQRDDTVERLRAKIIENTIGSRLRSAAIQGE